MAKRYGLALDRIDAATIEAGNDSLTQMGLAWNGLSTQLALKVAPAITLAADKIDHLISTMGGMEPVADRVFKAMAQSIKLVVSPMQSTYGFMQQLTVGMLEMYRVSQLLRIGLSRITGDHEGAIEAAQTILSIDKVQAEMVPQMSENLRGESWAAGIDTFFAEADQAAAKARREAEMLNRQRGINPGTAEAVAAPAEEAAAKLEKFASVTEKAVRATESWLSASEIASNARAGGTSGANKSIATRIERLRERQLEAEASGRFEAADKMAAQIDTLSQRLKRRARDESGKVLPFSPIMDVADVKAPEEGSQPGDITTATSAPAAPDTPQTTGESGLVAEIRALIATIQGVGDKLATA
jgi:hypothetical protein